MGRSGRRVEEAMDQLIRIVVDATVMALTFVALGALVAVDAILDASGCPS